MPMCDICGLRHSTAFDEDDRVWCLRCIYAWEAEHGRDWATGQTKTNRPWPDDTGGVMACSPKLYQAMTQPTDVEEK